MTFGSPAPGQIESAPRGDLDRATVERAYAGWAPVYDRLCGPVFRHGRQAAVAAARRVGGRVLEIGVGTGLSFPDYAGVDGLVGIDLSRAMLAKAEAKRASGRYPHVEALRLMDAHDLDFPDSCFDAAVAQFVITLVERPERVLDECARVVRPGGEIILMSHLYSERGAAAAVERWVAERARPIGIRPDMPFARLAAWAEEGGAATVLERRPVRPFYTLVRFRVNGDARDA